MELVSRQSWRQQKFEEEASVLCSSTFWRFPFLSHFFYLLDDKVNVSFIFIETDSNSDHCSVMPLLKINLFYEMYVKWR